MDGNKLLHDNDIHDCFDEEYIFLEILLLSTIQAALSIYYMRNMPLLSMQTLSLSGNAYTSEL
jgi:hypothetical protein